MSVPWKSQPKTYRDRLCDLGMGFSEIVASSLGNEQASSRREATRARIDKALRIEVGISIWQTSWFNEEYPHLHIRCQCQSPTMFSCICSVPASKFPNNGFALLQVECWALQLLISTTLSRLLAAEADFTTSWIANSPIRSAQIACHMEAVSALPALMHTAEPPPPRYYRGPLSFDLANLDSLGISGD